MYRYMMMVIVCLGTSFAHSEQSAVLFNPGFKFEGRSAAELSAEWWKWAMSSPSEINPVRDVTGANCNVGQRGNIWFLAGGFGSSKIKRRCVVPAGKHLFFPVINMVYWPREANSSYTCAQAKADAAVNNDSALDLFVEVDGDLVASPKRFRATTTECFDIFERINAAQKPYEAFPSASDGYWILLKPLSNGKHTIKFGGRYNTVGAPYGRTLQDIEYEILVE